MTAQLASSTRVVVQLVCSGTDWILFPSAAQEIYSKQCHSGVALSSPLQISAMAPTSICVADCVLGKPRDDSPRTQTPTSTRSALDGCGNQATSGNGAPRPTLFGMSTNTSGEDDQKASRCVPTPRVAATTSLPVLLGRSQVTPQRQDGDAEACARSAREAFLARQARRAGRFTNLGA